MFNQLNKPNGRSLPLDALRGFALFGVLVANIFLFNGYTHSSHTYLAAYPDKLNQITGVVVQYFFRGRFYPIFTFLFGLGIGIQFLKQASVATGTRLLLRRMFLLLLIGLAHYVLIWDGDILVRYSLAGFVAIAFVNLRKQMILAAAIAIYTVHSLYALQLSSAPALQIIAAEPGEQMSFLQLVLSRIRNLPISYGTVASFFYSVKILSFVLLGIYFSKSFFPLKTDKFTWFRLLPALVLMRAATAFVAFLSQNHETAILLSFANYLLNPAIYVAAFMLFVSYGVISKITKIFASIGRMSLTNYMLQNLVLAFIFYAYGLGQYQKWQPWQLIAFAFALFIAQGFVSYRWLLNHTQGPVEKVWRYYTYEQEKRKALLK